MVLTKKDTKAAKTIGSLTYFSNNIKHHFEPRGYKVSSGFTKKSFQNPDASSQVISFKLSLSPGPQSFRCFPCLCCWEKSLCHIVILLPSSAWNLQINYSYAKWFCMVCYQFFDIFLSIKKSQKNHNILLDFKTHKTS